jgi:hypothetical protein
LSRCLILSAGKKDFRSREMRGNVLVVDLGRCL